MDTSASSSINPKKDKYYYICLIIIYILCSLLLALNGDYLICTYAAQHFMFLFHVFLVTDKLFLLLLLLLLCCGDG